MSKESDHTHYRRAGLVPIPTDHQTIVLTERGHRLLALLHCREILPSSSTTVAAVLDRRIAGLLEDVDAA